LPLSSPEVLQTSSDTMIVQLRVFVMSCSRAATSTVSLISVKTV